MATTATDATPVTTAHTGAAYGGNKYGGYTGGDWNNPTNDPDYVAEPGFPVYHRRIANPGPLGLFAQATSLFLWGLYIVHARGVTESSFFLGMALSVGGIVQFLAGMWEFRTGNTFAATMFSMYGGFWFSVGLVYIPGTAGITAYGAANPDIFGAGGTYQFHQAVGFFFMIWFLFSFLIWLASFRSSVFLSLKLFLLWLSFLLLMSGEFVGHYIIIKAGGGVAISAACITGYLATASLLTHETSLYPLHKTVIELPKRSGGAATNRY